jgi:hypothetical protein
MSDSKSIAIKPINLILWVILLLIPVLNYFTAIVLPFAMHDRLKLLRPQTKRGVGKDFLLSIVTCGIFSLIVPALVTAEVSEEAKARSVEFKPMMPVYYLLVFGEWALALGGVLGALPGWLGYLYFILAPAQAVVFILPLNRFIEKLQAPAPAAVAPASGA